jgi:hypothetical protein
MKGIVCLLATLSAATCQAQYNAHVLHSPAVPSPFSFGAGAGGGQQVGHTNIILNGPSNALLWNGSAGSLVNLHPAERRFRLTPLITSSLRMSSASSGDMPGSDCRMTMNCEAY